MHDDSNPAPREKNSHHSTGPTSPEGKARSSLNRLDHGCRSEQLILPSEDPAEFEFTVNGWLAAYDPQDAVARTLIHETAKAHWFLKRNEKRLHQIESRLPGDAWQWTDENLRLFTNFSRYKTTAERAFFRWYKALEAHFDRDFQRQELADRARARAGALNIQWLNKREENAAADLKIDQFVHILGDDQVCATSLAPTNARIQELVAERPEPPKIITRYLDFRNGVPAAYDWIAPNLIQRDFPAIGIQRMLYSDWLRIVEGEQSSGSGHIGPAPSTEFLSFPPEIPA